MKFAKTMVSALQDPEAVADGALSVSALLVVSGVEERDYDLDSISRSNLLGTWLYVAAPFEPVLPTVVVNCDQKAVHHLGGSSKHKIIFPTKQSLTRIKNPG